MNCFFYDEPAYCKIVFAGDYVGGRYNVNFAYSTGFNGKVVFARQSTPGYNLDDCFLECENFNQPVIIPDVVKSAAGMFAGCTNFNSPVTFINGFAPYCNSLLYAPGMFANSGFNQPLTLPGHRDEVCSWGNVLSSCNYHSTVTCEGNINAFGEIIDNRSIHFHGPVIYNNYAIHTGGPSPYANQLVAKEGDASGLGILPSANTVGATVDYTYYRGGSIQVQQVRPPIDPNDPTTAHYEWVVLNQGNLPKVDDPFTEW